MDEWSQFRFRLIKPLLLPSNETLRARLQKLARLHWSLPNSETRQFSYGTIERWLYKYRSRGIKGLSVQLKKDNGAFSSISSNLREEVDLILAADPEIRTSKIPGILPQTVADDVNAVSQSTFYRYVAASRCLRKQSVVPDAPPKPSPAKSPASQLQIC